MRRPRSTGRSRRGAPELDDATRRGRRRARRLGRAVLPGRRPGPRRGPRRAGHAAPRPARRTRASCSSRRRSPSATPDVFAAFDAHRAAARRRLRSRMTSEHLAAGAAAAACPRPTSWPGPGCWPRPTTCCRPPRSSCPALVAVPAGADAALSAGRSGCPAPARPCGRSILRSAEAAAAAATRRGRPSRDGSVPALGDGPPSSSRPTIAGHRPHEEERDHDPPGRSRPPAPRPPSGRTARRIVAGDLVFCAGQLGLDPRPATLVEGGVEAQTERALRNLSAVLDAAGRRFARRRQDDDLPGRHGRLRGGQRVYARFMPDPPPPARRSPSAACPKGGRVEIEAIARRPTAVVTRAVHRALDAPRGPPIPSGGPTS